MIDDMPFDLIADALRHGGPPAGTPVNSAEDVAILNRRARRLLLGH